MNAPMSHFQAPPELTAEDFAARRRALAERVGEEGVVILPANREQQRNRDVHFPFRQDSDFLWLTGFPEPDAIAVFAPGRSEGELALFVRDRDPEREIWEGRRFGTDGACAHFGADEAHCLDDFEERLPKLLAGRRNCLLYTSPSPRDLSTSRMPSSA